MGYIYLILGSDDFYKIGRSKLNPEQRIKKLQTGNSTELQLIFTYITDNDILLERMLHNRFKQFNVLNEWFDLPKEEVKNFSNTCKELDDRCNLLLNENFFIKKMYNKYK